MNNTVYIIEIPDKGRFWGDRGDYGFTTTDWTIAKMFDEEFSLVAYARRRGIEGYIIRSVSLNEN